MRIDEFILARAAEGEAVAQAALGEPRYPHFGETAHEECVEMAANEGCAQEGVAFGWHFTPARVLAECAAFRAMAVEHRLVAASTVGQGDDPEGCAACTEDFCWGAEVVPGPCSTLTALASIWSDHPDYQEAWRPSE